MKRCPACKRAFDDDTLTVCPEDGSALAAASEVATMQSGSGLGGKATWNPTQDQLAEVQQTVAAITKPRRKSWPWVVVAIVVLLILIGVVGAIVVSRL
jgi:cobalamin biosynthesis Mg chelatase CobN